MTFCNTCGLNFRKKGHRSWTSFLCILIFGVFIYTVTCYILLRSDQQRTYMTWTHTDQNLTHYTDEGCRKIYPQADFAEFYSPLADHYNISYPYNKKWVGFSNFSHIRCQEPLNFPTLNRKYPTKLDRIFPTDFLEDAKNCTTFINKYGYLRYPSVSLEELEFPIAFVLLFHKDLDQVHFLLRAIYRRHNVYCLTFDTKASVEFSEATRSIARCLPNVFVSSKLENVVYSGFSRLMADLNCFKDLLNHPVPWKYVINEPGQAFPLRTNLEIVRILKLYNGTNDIEAKTGSQRLEDRYKNKWVHVTNRSSGEITLKKTPAKHVPPPHGLEIVKCSAYGAFTRSFVKFVITDQIAKDLLEWAKAVFSPDELYWATLNYNTLVQAPGGFKGVPRKKPWLTSISVWKEDKYSKCLTKFVRDVCIFSPADLPMLVKQRSFFANKFYITHHPVALHCLDQLIFNVTFSREVRDMEFYQSLDLVFRGGLETYT